MSIDEVIARSRLPGGFTEHKRFTIARGRAIEKLRRFALPDPHDYVLEFMQAAVANGAEWIALSIERKTCSIAYIGGGLREHELTSLFDFLFASKDRADVEHVRALALGINAALLFAPKRVVIESGDGTLEGTNRMVLQPGDNRVDIGRADRELRGTYIVLEDIDRDALPHRVAWSDHPREAMRLEERCLSAPIPIVVNGVPLFGFSSQRTPALFGFRKVVSFDEGDLYGSIGIDPGFTNPEFRLLTRGVAIQSKVFELVPGQSMGGVVCFDRLRKTVDHAAIVDDERLAEMWLRLVPYAETLVGTKQRGIASTHLLGQPPLPSAELCKLLREHKRVVVAPQGTTPSSTHGMRAGAIGRALGVPVLCASDEQFDWLYALSGRTVGLVRPELSDDDDLVFYGQAPAVAPSRPWVTAPIELPPCPIERLGSALGREGRALAELGRALGHAPMQLTLYTPREAPPGARWGLDVELLVTDRPAWRGIVGRDAGGHRLVVRLQDADLRALREQHPGGTTLAEAIAELAAELAEDAVARACTRALADREAVTPRSPQSWLAWQAVLRSVVPRLRTVGGVPALELLQIGDDESDLLHLPIVRTHAGEALDLHGLRERVRETFGAVLAAPAGACPRDVDRRLVLEVDDDEDRLLQLWLGDGTYVPIADEPPLAEHRGARILAFTPGARVLPSLPGLVGVGDVPAPERVAFARALVDQLVACARTLPLGDPRRAQALLHLQWAAVRSIGDAELAPLFVALPLFVREDFRPCTLRDLQAAAARGPLSVVFDREPWPDSDGELAVPDVLRCAPAIARALAEHMPIRPAFDVDVGVREPPEQAGLLVAIDIDDELALGRVGISRGDLPHSILVVSADGRSATEVHELAAEFGATGVVRVRAEADAVLEQLLERLRAALVRTVDRLREQVFARALADADHEIALGHLLELAVRSVRMGWNPDGTLMPHVAGSSASAILHMPILGSGWGGPVGPWWTIVRFCRLHASGETDPVARIVDELGSVPSPTVVAWMRRWLHAARVPARPRPPTQVEGVSTAAGSSQGERLCIKLERWLARLRPDTLLTTPARVQLHAAGVDQSVVAGVTSPIVINEDHALVQRALARPDDPELFAWLLLAIYAEINAVLDAVLNTHELAFQQRVVDALLAGELAGS